MNYNNLEQINNIYDDINKKNEKEYEDRISLIYDKHKDLKEIRQKLISSKINIAKCKIKNDTDNLKLLEKENIELESKYNSLLKEYNLNENDLERHYDCNICKDTGFVNGEKCKCYIEKEIEIIKKISHFDESDSVINKFDINVYKQDLLSVERTKYIEYMVSKFSDIKDMLLENKKNNKSINIFISGKTGTGKTFLSRYIGETLLNNNKTVIYITVNELLNEVFKNFNSENKNDNRLLSYIEDCDMLILDDLGKENITDFTIRYIYNLIDDRLNQKKSTIVCSCLNFTEINDSYDEGLTTRLFNYFYSIRLDGIDLRRV